MLSLALLACSEPTNEVTVPEDCHFPLELTAQTTQEIVNMYCLEEQVVTTDIPYHNGVSHALATVMGQATGGFEAEDCPEDMDSQYWGGSTPVPCEDQMETWAHYMDLETDWMVHDKWEEANSQAANYSYEVRLMTEDDDHVTFENGGVPWRVQTVCYTSLLSTYENLPSVQAICEAKISIGISSSPIADDSKYLWFTGCIPDGHTEFVPTTIISGSIIDGSASSWRTHLQYQGRCGLNRENADKLLLGENWFYETEMPTEEAIYVERLLLPGRALFAGLENEEIGSIDKEPAGSSTEGSVTEGIGGYVGW